MTLKKDKQGFVEITPSIGNRTINLLDDLSPEHKNKVFLSHESYQLDVRSK
ncbi:MAG: hypothetical protein CM15mP109_13600 [Candidatus Dadabacteria bacterium]|nr:MAG: hypothetical protein CM15mP109_13600 [Candidatus Dadabacteria bacterium]